MEQVRRRGAVRRRDRIELLRDVPRAHAEHAAELREKRFRNVGDPRRTDRFKSTYEHGVQSPFVLHAIAAYERAFKLMEQTLAERGPWLLGAKPTLADINLMPLPRGCPISGCSKPGPTSARASTTWWAQAQEWPSFRRGLHDLIIGDRVRRDAQPRAENPRRRRQADRRAAGNRPTA